MARTHDDSTHYHIVGIGRADLSGIARLLHARGGDVSGSSLHPSRATEQLDQAGIEYRVGYDPTHVEDADALVAPHSIASDHVEIRAARARDLIIYRRWELLAELLRDFRTIGVTGTHGRGTMAGMITWILELDGRDPGFLASGELANFGTSARDTEGRWMVVELDTSIADSRALAPDYFVSSFMDETRLGDDPESVIEDMADYVGENGRLKEAFINLDCQGNRRLAEQATLRPTGYSTRHPSEFRAVSRTRDESGLGFEMHQRHEPLGDLELEISGNYNIVNALGAAAVAHRLGISMDVVREGIATYQGHERRYAISRGGGVTVVRDRGRQVEEVRRVINSSQRLTDDCLQVVLAPDHLLELLESPDAFDGVLEGVDGLLAVECDENRPPEQLSRSTWESCREQCRARDIDLEHVVEREALLEHLTEVLSAGDAALFLGDESCFDLADAVEAELARASEATPRDPQQPRVDGPLVD